MNTQLNALMAGERLGDLLRHAGHAWVGRPWRIRPAVTPAPR